MALKVSNETKVGALTAITITLLILGFNFLKGNNPMKKSMYLYAKFPTIEGLVPANPVICNGLVIGSVYKTEPADELLTSVLVTIRISENVKLPVDSRATIKGNLLSTPAVEITKGVATTYLNKADTIPTAVSSGFLGAVLDQLGPTQTKLNSALGHLDTLLEGANDVLDAPAREQLRQTIANLSVVTSNLAKTAASVNNLVQGQNNAITNAIKNLEEASNTLKNGLQQLPDITRNLDSVSGQLAASDIKGLTERIDATIGSLKTTLDKLNSSDGSAGALMNDRKLYDNLARTTNSLNLLLQDLRLHPKRYINVSVFGKKDKTSPLMRPMQEDSITQEQIKNRD